MSDRERWDLRHAQAQATGPAPVWLAAIPGLPGRGRALDVASGRGRVAVWLAARGLETLAVDVSPVGLERAAAAARERGLALDTRVVDLERDLLPAGPFDVITCFHYLQRDLFPALAAALAPGGLLCCEIATRRNLERHAHPSARFLLEEGELPNLLAPLLIREYREGWLPDRHLARAAAERV